MTMKTPPATVDAEPTTWWGKHKVVIITLATCLVLALVAVAASWYLRTQNENPQNQLRSSSTYEMISTVLAQEPAQEPASMLVAPPTEKWWKYLSEGNMNTQVAEVPFEAIATKASYFAYTISPGAGYENHLSIGLPTTFIVYETNADAVAVGNGLSKNGVSSFVRGNLVLLLPPGAHTDVDYSLSQFIRSGQTITQKDINLGDQALLSINFSEFQKVYPQNWEENEKEIFQQAFALAGVQPEGSGWVGTSTDGKIWKGNLFGFVPTPELVTNPGALHDFLGKQVEYTLDDGTKTTESPVDDFSGVIDFRQGAAADYLNVATQDSARAGIFDTETSTLMEVKPLKERGSNDRLEVTVDVNEWLGNMEGMNSSVNLLPVERVVFTLHDMSGASTIQFTEKPEEEFISPDETALPEVENEG